jgi:hypothetical protein
MIGDPNSRASLNGNAPTLSGARAVFYNRDDWRQALAALLGL